MYLVGGGVRDLLTGGRPLDLDLAVEGGYASPDGGRIGEEVVVHDRFGTSDGDAGGFTYDIARTRSERYPRPGALPDVDPAGIEEDLRRRDFTVNALAAPLGGEQPGSSWRPRAGSRTSALRCSASSTNRASSTIRRGCCAWLGTRAGCGSDRAAYLHPRAFGAAGDALGPWPAPESGPSFASSRESPTRSQRSGRSASWASTGRSTRPSGSLTRNSPGARSVASARAPPRPPRARLAARAVPAPELESLLDSLAFGASDRDAVAGGAVEADAAAAHAGRRPPVRCRPRCRRRRGGGRTGRRAGPGRRRTRVARAAAPRAARDRRTRSCSRPGCPEGPAVGRGLAAALAAKLDGTAAGREAELAAALRAARATG